MGPLIVRLTETVEDVGMALECAQPHRSKRSFLEHDIVRPTGLFHSSADAQHEFRTSAMSGAGKHNVRVRGK